ncbi:hypothetical protein LZ32DRAFT_161097 [Colletotrichum eremochloae]|nr:hypothetical protein LZ32DRAFT_161097 [Colletotrichum eremochloae]
MDDTTIALSMLLLFFFFIHHLFFFSLSSLSLGVFFFIKTSLVSWVVVFFAEYRKSHTYRSSRMNKKKPLFTYPMMVIHAPGDGSRNKGGVENGEGKVGHGESVGKLCSANAYLGAVYLPPSVGVGCRSDIGLNRKSFSKCLREKNATGLKRDVSSYLVHGVQGRG